MEHFVMIVNAWKPLTIITKSSILDVAAILDPPLIPYFFQALYGQNYWLKSKLFQYIFENEKFLLSFADGHTLLVLFLFC